MKNLYIVANWKSNKTQLEAREWLQEISRLRQDFHLRKRFGGQVGGQANLINQASNLSNKKIIVCPSFIHLSLMKAFIEEKKLPIKLGTQNISPFDEGAYTGEVNGKQIKDLAEFVIVGHSERQKNFFESIEMINLKITQAFKHGLIPIVCVSNLDQAKALQEIVRGNSQFSVAYEPLFAIGSGTADTPENADQMARGIKDVLGEIPVLYGGSVTSGNINGFSKMPNIDGVLIGGASLDAKEFYAIIQNA